MRRSRRNPLLSRPPAYFHRVSDERRVARMGPDPYLGVHTTDVFNIAAAYAMSTWEKNSRNGYPVVLSLDVANLKPYADVDGYLRAEDTLYDSSFRNNICELLQEGRDPWDIAEYFNEREYERVTGWAQAIFEEYQEHLNPASAITDVYDDPDEAEAVLRAYACDGADLPDAVLAAIVRQQRYLVDFYFDRLCRVEAFRPWYPDLLEEYWEDESPERTQAEEAGWHVIILEDILESGADFNPGEIVTLYERPKPCSHSEYHGTVSFIADEAFPELELPEDIWHGSWITYCLG